MPVHVVALAGALPRSLQSSTPGSRHWPDCCSAGSIDCFSRAAYLPVGAASAVRSVRGAGCSSQRQPAADGASRCQGRR